MGDQCGNQRAIQPDAEHARRHASRNGGEENTGGEGVIGHVMEIVHLSARYCRTASLSDEVSAVVQTRISAMSPFNTLDALIPPAPCAAPICRNVAEPENVTGLPPSEVSAELSLLMPINVSPLVL